MRQLSTALGLCLLLAACGGGGGASSGSTSSSVGGKVSFDRVPIALDGSTPRLDYTGITRLPARAVLVEAIDAGDLSVRASATTNEAGDYTLTLAAGHTVFIRAKAATLRSGSNALDFAVIDNTSSGAQWAIDGAPFTTGTSATNAQNLHAASGWNGSAYDDAQRAAGPFALLDTLQQAAQKIIAVDAAATFPALRVNWSPNNVAASGSLALGQIGTSFFTSTSQGGITTRSIYVLGKSNSDTDEYDAHVVAHEFGHYLQSAFSRDDSIGGPHGGANDRLDMRVAFSEGWGNAWSGLALNNRIYSDTLGPGQASGFSFDVSAGDSLNPGWFKEFSVQKMVWDFSNETSLGFSRVWAVMKSGLTVSPALTSIHAFAHSLASSNPASAATINSILASQGIELPGTAYGENETNFGTPAMTDVQPVYLSYGTLGSSLAAICVNNAADPGLSGNKAGEYRYVRMSLPTGNRSFTVTQSSSTPTATTDPDFVLYAASGSLLRASGTAQNTETAAINLPAGDYVLALTDFKLLASSGGNSRSCFNLSVT